MTAPTRQRPAAARPSAADVATTTAIAFALVFSTAAPIATTMRMRAGEALGPSLKAGLISAQRWGRVSAGFNGGKLAARWHGVHEVACTAVGAALGGAAGSTSLAQMPQRSALFLVLAVGAEHGIPPLVRRTRSAISAETKARQEIFLRVPPQPKPSLPRAHLSNDATGPLERVKRMVDRMNRELGTRHDRASLGLEVHVRTAVALATVSLSSSVGMWPPLLGVPLRAAEGARREYVLGVCMRRYRPRATSAFRSFSL